MELDWETVLRALPLIVGAIVSLYKLRDVNPRLRSTLKSDAEILEKLDPNSAAYKSLKQSIEARVTRLSAEPRKEWKEWKKWNRSEVALGVVFLLFFGSWTVYVLRDGFSWWALLTGYLTLSGGGILLMGFEGHPKPEPGTNTISGSARDPAPNR